MAEVTAKCLETKKVILKRNIKLHILAYVLGISARTAMTKPV